MAPMVLLGLGSVLAGGLFVGEFHALVTPGENFSFHFTVLGGVGLGLALGGLLVAWFSHAGSLSFARLRPLGAWIQTGPIDSAFRDAYKKVLLNGASLVAWLDRYVIDGFINAIGWVLLRSAKGSADLQTGRIDHYIWAVVMGALALVLFGVWGI